MMAGFPDLTGDGKVTRADVLKGRGVKLNKKQIGGPIGMDEKQPLEQGALGQMYMGGGKIKRMTKAYAHGGGVRKLRY